ncbi:MAG: PTS fructose transporter subunit IIA [Vitreoscilla sp.]|nr:PTS fructose transporter subunit IIA [Vitreoscilla sp.]MBP6674549.1 PTS fructose transporter subunit IIA [Vitreoscilla sp.]
MNGKLQHMPGLLIMAHAPLASALRDVAAHVFPDCLATLDVLDVPPDWDAEQTETAARQHLSGLAHQQTLILTDVFGATPCNVAHRMADGVNIRVVAGVNVPMLWRALCYAKEPLDALVARAVAGGTQGVVQMTVQRPQNQSNNPTSHDQEHAHHQQ